MTEIDICNAALAQIDAEFIDSFDPEEGRESEICGALFAVVAEEELESWAWTWAEGVVELSRRSAAPPDPAWSYAYDVPTDFLAVRRTALEGDVWRVTGAYGAAEFWSNSTPVTLYYTRNAPVGAWSKQFRGLVVDELSAKLAISIRRDKVLAELWQESAERRRLRARANDASQMRQHSVQQVPRRESVRFGGDNLPLRITS